MTKHWAVLPLAMLLAGFPVVASAQYEEFPPDSVLRAGGLPTREEMRKTQLEIDGLMNGPTGINNLGTLLMDSLKAEWARTKEANALEASQVGHYEPPTLAEMMENPESVVRLFIDLSKEHITTLPENFSDLKNLKLLVIANLPEGERFDFDGAFQKIAELEVDDLFIINNKSGLEMLPPSIGRLKTLSLLDLSRNSLGSLPEEIGNLTGLSELALCKNNLKTLPSTLQKLDALKELDLRKNSVTTSEVTQLRSHLKQCVIKEGL